MTTLIDKRTARLNNIVGQVNRPIQRQPGLPGLQTFSEGIYAFAYMTERMGWFMCSKDELTPCTVECSLRGRLGPSFIHRILRTKRGMPKPLFFECFPPLLHKRGGAEGGGEFNKRSLNHD